MGEPLRLEPVTPDHVGAACGWREGRRRGFAEATVLRVPAEGGPGPFHERLGVRPTGEEFAGQVVGRIPLCAAGAPRDRTGPWTNPSCARRTSPS